MEHGLELYLKNGQLFVCLVKGLVVPNDPDNTQYAVMQDYRHEYPPFLVDLSSDPDWRKA